MADWREGFRLNIRLKNMKLQRKFMLSYLLVCIIPLAAACAIIYHQSARSLQEAAEEFAALYTSQIQSSVQEFIDEYDRLTKSVLIDNDIISRLNENGQLSMDERIINNLVIDRILMRIAVLRPEVSSIMLITRNDDVYQYANGNWINTINEAILLEQQWYKQSHYAEDTLFITPLHDRSYYEDKGGGAVFTVGRILLSGNGAYAGVLLIDLDPSQLLKLNQDFWVARDRYDMRVIVNTRSGGMVYHSDLVIGKLIWKEIEESAEEIGQASKREDLIQLSGSTNADQLVVRTEIPRDKLLLKIEKIKYSTWLIIAISILIIIAASFTVSATVVKPIKNLRRSMKLVEAGQYAPIAHNAANDEIGSLVGSYNKMIATIKTLIEDVYLAEIKQRHAQYLSLQTQINPHMLYNTLESIRMKAIMKDDEEIAAMIKILARMFRLTLSKDGGQNVIRQEVDYAENYVQLQNMRFDNLFTLSTRLGEEVLDCPIMPLVFQPIVENSIAHGFVDYDHPIRIAIEGDVTELGDIRISITDNGAGMTAGKLEELNDALGGAAADKSRWGTDVDDAGKGIGLANIAERIRLQYGERYRVSVQSVLGTGTTVQLLIPGRSSKGDYAIENSHTG
ncbi:sensor histidine kinase [Paenibacillus sp. J5C_2022]|uniref:cache domain-containing sensor histidine kinase n=1 Tax=Paenibacillus sp. J5C2022 TaxID=2977129 RepID=UPI0021CEEE61|nr:sensor histidine kinase [Paenibacillus sp. J5C2022]MCU6709078.1 sensor histidine kinase [Paenibacillus sp. J5C2022]